MTINITPEIDAAYKRYLNETVDADFRGTPILRRSTYPYVGNEYCGLVDFAAGALAAREVRVEPVVGPLSGARSDLPSMPPPAASLPVSAPAGQEDALTLSDELIDATLGLAYDSSGLNGMTGQQWDRIVARRFFFARSGNRTRDHPARNHEGELR